MIVPTDKLPLGMFENLFDGPDILIVLVIALIFFGNRLPGVAKSLGRSIVEFKKGLAESHEELNKSVDEEPPIEKPDLTAMQDKTSDKPHQIKRGTNISEEP
ncbi:MAG: Sec-independent protein translocase subunit TatA/TatB [Phycisphaerae bacterium]